MANKNQLKLLKQSIKENNGCRRWNNWRKKYPEVEIDLFCETRSYSGKVDQRDTVELVKCDIKGINLRGGIYEG